MFHKLPTQAFNTHVHTHQQLAMTEPSATTVNANVHSLTLNESAPPTILSVSKALTELVDSILMVTS